LPPFSLEKREKRLGDSFTRNKRTLPSSTGETNREGVLGEPDER